MEKTFRSRDETLAHLPPLTPSLLLPLPHRCRRAPPGKARVVSAAAGVPLPARGGGGTVELLQQWCVALW